MELLKLLSANEIVAQVISFLLLLFILRKFLWKKFLKVLDDRRERIAQDLKRIEETRLEVEAIKADYNKRLGEIDETLRLKTEEAIAEGRRIAEELREGAEEDAKRFTEAAKAAIKDELAKAREELKGEIVDITINIAEKVIEEKLTEAGDRRLVEEFLKEAGDIH